MWILSVINIIWYNQFQFQELVAVTVYGIVAYWFLNFNLIRQRRLVSLYCIFVDGFIKEIGRRLKSLIFGKNSFDVNPPK